MSLKNIFNDNNCDKGYKHQYYDLYEKDFEEFRYKFINILEIGVLRGESIKSWLEYFPNATIYVVDIFKQISEYQIPILNHDRVKWCKADSTNENVKSEIKKFGAMFDIIIDDGLHTPEANKLTFLNLIDFLKNQGTYYVEDFFPMTKMSKDELQIKFLEKKSNVWNIKNVNDFLNTINSFNVEEFDNRNITGHQDSFIYKIKK